MGFFGVVSSPAPSFYVPVCFMVCGWLVCFCQICSMAISVQVIKQ